MIGTSTNNAPEMSRTAINSKPAELLKVLGFSKLAAELKASGQHPEASLRFAAKMLKDSPEELALVNAAIKAVKGA